MGIDRAGLVRTFLDHTKERIGRMEEALIALQGTPDYPDLVDGIRRDARAIETNAFALGLTDLAEIAAAIEELVGCLPEVGPDLTSIAAIRLRSGTGMLREKVAAALAAVGT